MTLFGLGNERPHCRPLRPRILVFERFKNTLRYDFPAMGVLARRRAGLGVEKFITRFSGENTAGGSRKLLDLVLLAQQADAQGAPNVGAIGRKMQGFVGGYEKIAKLYQARDTYPLEATS